MFGEALHKTVFDKAAAYLFHLVQNHPFNDGNKRTGALTAIIFLELNGVNVTFAEDEYEDFVVEVAKGKRNKAEIAYFLQHGEVIVFSTQDES